MNRNALPKELEKLSDIQVMKELFDSEKVSEVNRNILKVYFVKMLIKRLSHQTIDYNAKIIEFYLENVRTDLDKITK